MSDDPREHFEPVSETVARAAALLKEVRYTSPSNDDEQAWRSAWEGIARELAYQLSRRGGVHLADLAAGTADAGGVAAQLASRDPAAELELALVMAARRIKPRAE